MNNSLVKYLQDAYTAVLVDIGERYPEIHKELDRDKKRLLSAINDHQAYFCSVTLPEFGKVFDLALAHGRLPSTRLLHMRPYQEGSTVPRLFKGLLLRVFDSNGTILDRPDRQAIRFLRQLYRLAKKLELPCKPIDTWRSVNEFYQIDRECKPGSLDWDLDSIDCSALDNLHLADYSSTQLLGTDLFGDVPPSAVPEPDGEILACIQFAADIIATSIGGINPLDWNAKHGPGAVSDLADCESKFDFPHWPDKLEHIFPFAEIGCSSYSTWVECLSDNGSAFKHEPPSKLIAVPKTLDKPRLIASEPISHQWCQQIVLDFLSERVKKTFIGQFIHLRDQTFNGRAALSASRDCDMATIDLSSASDRLSCFLVERIFRKNPSLLQAYHACRTRWISNDIDKKSPRFHKLAKFSTMGSALTFPVQSIVFLSVAIGCVLHARRLKPSIKNIRALAGQVLVFGDDTIVPIDAWNSVCQYLTTFGLKINHNKTFGTGKFRESCGVDAYDGEEVTAVHLIKSGIGSDPESVVSLVETANNLEKKGYSNVAKVIKRVIPSYAIARKRPDSGAFGLIWDGIEELPNLRTRFNSKTHIREILTLTMKSVCKRTKIRGDSMLLQYFTEACKAEFVHSNRLGKASRPKTRLSLGWVPADEYFIKS